MPLNDPLSSTFAALADPTRRAILARLQAGDASVAELARPFEMTVRAISKHIAVLERAGLVERRQQAQRRLSRLRPERLKLAEEWLVAYRAQWDARMEKIDRVLKDMQKENDSGPRA